MRGKPGGEPAGRATPLVALVALPAILLASGLAARGWVEGRAAFLAELERRAAEQHRIAQALLEGPADAEVSTVLLPRDEAGARERLRALVATLDWPAGTIRLVEAADAPALADAAGDPLTFRRPIGTSGLSLEHRVEPGAVRRAAIAGAAPWLLALSLLASTAVVAELLVRRRILAPAVAALDALVAAAAGRPSGAALRGWAAAWVEAGRRAARERAERAAAAEATEATLLAALEAVEEGVAVVDGEGRLVFANGAFTRAVERGGAEACSGRTLDAAARAALAATGSLRELPLASGGRLLLLARPAASLQGGAAPAGGPPPIGTPRLAAMVQEVAEALALVARQAVLLHELAAEPGTRTRAGELRRAVERCTRAIAPLLAPGRAARPASIGADEGRGVAGEREPASLATADGPPRSG
jgi:PAS domain-containing protein